MTTMVGEIYDAFIDAGASPDMARKAAEAVAAGDARISKVELDQSATGTRLEAKLDRLDAKIDRLDAKLESEVKSVRSELTLINWMGGLILASNLALVTRANLS